MPSEPGSAITTLKPRARPLVIVEPTTSFACALASWSVVGNASNWSRAAWFSLLASRMTVSTRSETSPCST